MHTLAPHRRLVAVLAITWSALVLLPGHLARAAEITATSTSGARGGPGCTLRDAITAANTDAATGGCPAGNGADTIILTPGATYTLTEVDNLTVRNSIEEPNGLPSVTSDITIIGNGATIARCSTDGTPAFRLLHVAPDGRLTINGLTLTNGKMPDMPATEPGPGGDGGGILNEGVLTLVDVALTANSAGNTPAGHGSFTPETGCAGRGGGVFNAGTLTVNGGAVSFNHAGSNAPGDVGGRSCAGAGGGIYNDTAAILTLNGTTVNENAAGDDVDRPGGDGGGIFNAGNLVITSSTLTGNTAGDSDDDNGGNGGAVANVASAVFIDSTVAGNTAGMGDSYGGDGGGVFNAGTVTLTRCTISGNAAGDGTGGGSGGGLANRDGGTLSLVNSTVSGNQAGCGDGPGDGGGIFNTGTVTLASCTISGNSGGQGGYGTSDGMGGGGIAGSGPLTALKNTLVAENTIIDENWAPIAGDCDGLLTSQGYNFIQGLTNCTVTGDVITGLDPHLGPLQNNGGATETQALLSGSPAIDAGNPDGCTDADGNVLTTDQRGAPRALAGDARCDIGAFEASWPAWPTITMTPTSTPTSTPLTPSVTPTRTPTPTPTATPTWAVAVDVGSATGSPGQQVTIGVFLKSRSNDVVAIQNDIAFDPSTPVTEDSDGTPACAVNPAIHKSARFAFRSCSDWWIRALVFPLDGLSPIPDGSLLYTCSVAISPSATAGTRVLANSGVIASDAAGHSLPATGGADGSIVVLSGSKGIATATTSPTPTSTATVPIARSIPTSTSPPVLNGAPAAVSAPDAPTAGDGCALAPKQDHERGTWLVLLFVTAFLVHRWGRSSSRWLSTS